MGIQQSLHLAGPGDCLEFLPVPAHLLQVLPDGFFHKEALGILWQHGQAILEQFRPPIGLHLLPKHPDFPPVGFANAADRLEHGGLPRAVAAYDGKETALRHHGADPPEHIRAVFFIPKPDFLQHQGRRPLLPGYRRFRQRLHLRRGLEGSQEPIPALSHREGTYPLPLGSIEYPSRSGHGGEHGVMLRP